MDLFNDIQQAVGFFLSGLNWTYIITFGMVTYGIKNEPEFEWYNDLTKKTKLGTWIAGVIVIGFFCLFTWLEDSELKAAYVSTLLRSFIMTIVLSRVVNSVFSTYIKKKLHEAQKDDKPEED